MNAAILDRASTSLTAANRRLDDVGSVRSLAVLRIALGPLVVLHLRPFLENHRDGIIWSDRFHQPFSSLVPEPGRGLYGVLLWLTVAAAVALSLGLFTRLAAAWTAGFVVWNVALSQTHFHHNRAFLIILLVGTALLPVGDHLSIDAWRRRRRGSTTRPTPLWPLWLLRIEVALVYVASGTSKLVDPDWWGGTVLALRTTYSRQLALDAGAPAWSLDLLADETFQWWFSKATVLTELAIGIGLLHRRTRLLAIWLAIAFHVLVQVTSRVQIFSWAALAALVIWATPSSDPDRRDRRLALTVSDAGLGRWVRRLDWLGRFEVIDDADASVLHDRETLRTGSDLRLTTFSRLPLTFWFVAPVLLLQRRR